MSVTQKEGVFGAIVELFGFVPTKGLEFKPTKEQRKEIMELVAVGIMEGDIDFSADAKAKYPTFKDVKDKYVPGLLSNWLRKDKRLNGDVEYVAKNPGSRAGQGDDTLKNLKALRATMKDKAHLEAIDEEIKKRTDELAAKKAKAVVVDLSKIPEHLRIALGLDNVEAEVADEVIAD